MSRRDRKCPRMSDESFTASGGSRSAGTLQPIVSLIKSGDLDAAGVAARSLGDSALSCEAWALIASANANLQRLVPALEALQNALEYDPGSRPLRLQRALLLERAGRA